LFTRAHQWSLHTADHHPIFTIHSNIIPSTPRSYDWLLHSGFPLCTHLSPLCALHALPIYFSLKRKNIFLVYLTMILKTDYNPCQILYDHRAYIHTEIIYQIFYMLTITNMAMARYSEVISDRINVRLFNRWHTATIEVGK
jgi:hypothetical protein